MSANPRILKRELEAMSKSALVELAWAVYEEVQQEAMLFRSTDECILTPDQFLEIYEEKVHPYETH
jgi:hypothetical protein